MADFSQPEMRTLPHALTDEELLQRGQQQARALEQYDQADADRKAAADQFKQKMTTCWAEAQRLSGIIRTRQEYRETECMWVPDYDHGTVALFRCDSHEMVEERRMTPDELQARMRFDG